MSKSITQKKGSLNKTVERSDTKQLGRLWVYRMLFRCGGIKVFINNPSFHEDAFAYLSLSDSQIENLAKQQIKALVKTRFGEISTVKIKRRSPFFKNIKTIQSEIGLSRTDTEILTFVSLIQLDNKFGRCFDLLESLNNGRLYSILSYILDLPKEKIIQSLHRQGILHRSGLVKVKSGNNDMDCKFEILNGFCYSLETRQKDVMALFSGYINPSAVAELDVGNYQHIRKDYDRLHSYLKQVCDNHIIGANILLYGPPGTGKTQLVRSLVRDAGLRLFEISTEDFDGDTLSGDQRLASCQLGQILLQRYKNCGLLFDEIEDLFPNDFMSFLTGQKRSGKDKAWINQLLEKNETPTFWITNSINSLDNAFVRRFDYVMELKVPPRQTRKRILTESLGDTTVSKGWIDRISSIEDLSPAVVERAIHTSRIIGLDQQQSQEAQVEQIISNTLNAMGISFKPKINTTENIYDAALLQTSENVMQVSQGLSRTRQGRLCFFGPSGTGKSAYAEHLAESLEMPLIAKQASDIIDAYIGETEKNIARMFEQAADEKGVLLLDEADSFLRDRSQSRNSWEVTQANELLVQMENHQGIFICSTNLMDELDPAVLRRFDFKVGFDYLAAEQAWQLFCRYLASSLSGASSKTRNQIQMQFDQLDQLTPGDFAVVCRKLSVLDKSGQPEEFIKALKEEIKFKPDYKRRSIGFLAEI